MSDFNSIREMSEALSSGNVSAVELASSHLQQIEKAASLNAFVDINQEVTLAQAKASDERRSKGEVGRLEGIPLGIKDLFCTPGFTATSCSRILEHFTPTYESHVTGKLRAEGAVFLGKLNMDEFAMGSSNETSVYGPCINPWRAEHSDDKLVPGGSSGGSASAVAAGLCLGATGTDTGGSIRQPASLTGIVGIKPTYGRCSRWGIIAFASSLDQAGPMARNVADAALMLDVMSGHDPRDATSSTLPVPDFAGAVGQDVKGMKIGIPKEFAGDNLGADIRKIWENGAQWLADQGAEIVEVGLPHTEYALAAYYIIAPAEASSNLARYDGVRYGRRAENPKDLEDLYARSRAEGFGDEVKRRILVGTHVLSSGYYDAYYNKAQSVRRLIRDDFEKAFSQVDLLLTPTSPNAAFPIGAELDPLDMYLNDVFTVSTNLAGLPAMSVPAALNAQNLPLGLQLIGPAFGEEKMIAAGAALERAAKFHARPTPWWLPEGGRS